MNEIICADCLDILKSMPDKSVDLVLTDPPYGIGVDYGAYEDSQDNLRGLIAKFMPEVLRVGKVVALTPGNKNIFLYPKPDWILSWVVPAGTGMSCWGFVCWHAILVYGKDPYLVNNLGSRPDIIIGDNLKVNHDHPCAKPLNVWKKILERCSVKESDVVLDPFAGSGTTCVAAKILGRKYIGIEISPVYAAIARKRVEQAQYEERLFAVTA